MTQLVWRDSCVADRLPVVVRFPAGPRVRLDFKRTVPQSINGQTRKKKSVWERCVWKLCVSKLCESKLCVRKLWKRKSWRVNCMGKVVCGSYVSKLCQGKFCVRKLCESKLCVSK